MKLDKKLVSANTRAVYEYIDRWAGEAWTEMTYSEIAEAAGISVATARRCVARLKRLGVVQHRPDALGGGPSRIRSERGARNEASDGPPPCAN